MTKYITDFLDYFFGFNPPTNFNLQWILWILIALGLLTGFSLIFVVKTSHDSHLKKSVQQLPGKFITISFLLLLNLFSRFNRIEVLSMRFITYILVAWLLFSFYQLINQLLIKLPALRAHQEAAVEHLERKYHIHKNKKRKTLSR